MEYNSEFITGLALKLAGVIVEEKIYKGREALVALAEGKKLTRDCWHDDFFIYMDINSGVYDPENVRVGFDPDVNHIEYQEPKKQKEITLYRYTYRYKKELIQGLWTASTFKGSVLNDLSDHYMLLKTETKTILVDDLEDKNGL